MSFILGLLALICIVCAFLPKQFDLPSGLFKIGAGIFGVLTILFALNPFVIIDGGKRGVVTRLGAIQSIELQEGLNIINPLFDKVDQWDVRVFKSQVKSASVSSDLQTINTESALNYHVDPEKAAELKQKVGSDFADVIIAPVIQESLKASTAKYPIQELTANRALVRDAAKALIIAKLAPYYIKVDDYSILNFDFSDKFEAAIEAKQVSEQRAEQAKFELQRVEIDSQQAIARAKAEAEGLKAQREQITPELLELRRIEMQARAIEKWHGDVPQYMMGNSTPFIQLTPGK
mgnify:FL=1